MTKPSSQGQSTDPSGKERGVRERWDLAKATMSEVRDAPNQERRGRTLNQALQRIENYLSNDALFKKLAERVSAVDKGDERLVERFREHVEHSIAVFERLSNRNPEIRSIERLGEDLTKVYHLLTVNVYGILTRRHGDPVEVWNPMGVRSRAQNSPASVPTSQISESSGNEPSPKIQNTQEHHSPEQTQHREELFDNKIFDEVCAYMQGQMGSVRDQTALYDDIQKVLLRSPLTTAGDLIRDGFPTHSSLHQQLKEVSDLVGQCSKLMSGMEMPCTEMALLSDRIADLSQGHSFHSNPLPMQRFIEEGVLSVEMAEKIEESSRLIRSAPRVVLTVLAHLSNRHFFSTSHVKELCEVEARLKFAQMSDEEIGSKLSQTLKTGPGKIGHLLNVATLANAGVEVRDLFHVSREAESVVDAAAHGKLISITSEHPSYKPLIQRALDLELLILREPHEVVRRAVREAELKLPKLGDNEQLTLKEILLALGKSLPATAVSIQLTSVAPHLVELQKAGVDLFKFADMVKCAGGQGTASISEYLQYASNLATLSRLQVQGASKLFANSFHVWNRVMKGDRTQDISGFLVEADVALKLQRHGYKLLSVSQALQSKFDYDILAIDSAGVKVGIEVKRQLATIVDKNGWAADKIHLTQLWRHCTSAVSDQIEPRIVVMDGSQLDRYREPVTALTRKVQERLRVKLQVISAVDGKTIIS